MKTTCLIATFAILAGGTISDSRGEPSIRSSKSKDLAATMASVPELATFHSLVKASGLEATLRGKGPYTILAPTDAAFRMMPDETLSRLKDPANRSELSDWVSYHIIPGSYTSSGIDTTEVTTLQGSKLVLHREVGTIWIGRAEVLQPDRQATNGTIHVINMVLEPDRQE
jgi:uncharacterized surface protein with fasciclin (FAS1) repeats